MADFFEGFEGGAEDEPLTPGTHAMDTATGLRFSGTAHASELSATDSFEVDGEMTKAGGPTVEFWMRMDAVE